jgi:endonuclease YncB( thermonuclease family)
MYGPSYQYAATMNRTIDGDTYEVMVDLGFNIFHSIHVRLRAFDTPELRGSSLAEKAHAQAATAFVNRLLPKGTPLILTTAKSAVYNRWEADVWYVDTSSARQLSLKDTLIANDFAKRLTYA